MNMKRSRRKIKFLDVERVSNSPYNFVYPAPGSNLTAALVTSQ